MGDALGLCTLHIDDELSSYLIEKESYDAAPRMHIERLVFCIPTWHHASHKREQLTVCAINRHVTLNDSVRVWTSEVEQTASCVRTWLRIKALRHLIDPRCCA